MLLPLQRNRRSSSHTSAVVSNKGGISANQYRETNSTLPVYYGYHVVLMQRQFIARKVKPCSDLVHRNFKDVPDTLAVFLIRAKREEVEPQTETPCQRDQNGVHRSQMIEKVPTS